MRLWPFAAFCFTAPMAACVDKGAIPPIDTAAPAKVETATFALG